jgi:predicted lipoprotein with Yx(FWY)xxD motif
MKTFTGGIVAVGFALVLAACSSSSASPYGGGSSPATGMMTVGTDKVPGIGTVLDDAQGLTLYHLTTETGGKIECTGSCATAWPPVLVTGSLPKATGTLTGTFGTVKRPDGTTQLTYAGMPLYTYAGDPKPGVATGQGLQGVWFAVMPSGSSASGRMPTTNGGSSGISGGVGYSSTSGSSSSRGGYSSGY